KPGPLRNQRLFFCFVIGFDFLKFFCEFERLNRIEPERTHTPQSLTSRACACRSASEEGCEEQFMLPIRIVAIPTEVAEAVRTTLRAPVYGFPAHAELATDAAPCRHCLRITAPGEDRRILFAYDRFSGLESLPQPGPIYIHANNCSRYPENGGFPEELRSSPRTLEAYARGRRLLAQE